MTLKRWNKPGVVCDYDGSNEREDESASFASRWGKAEPFCWCGQRTAVVWHLDCDHLLVLCARCAIGFALGVLRDVTEAEWGESVAEHRYEVARQRFRKLYLPSDDFEVPF
jgi:hypothetical protein